MKDLIITINANTRKASVSKTFAGITGENLQGNIIFDFVGEFIDGTGYLDFDNGQKYSVQMIKEENRYTVSIHNSLLQKIGKVKIQLRIEQTTEQTTVAIFKSRIIELPVLEALDQSEMPIDYARLGEKTITANGTYNASDDDADGYSKVVVDIESFETITGTISKYSGNSIVFADIPKEPKSFIIQGSYFGLYSNSYCLASKIEDNKRVVFVRPTTLDNSSSGLSLTYNANTKNLTLKLSTVGDLEFKDNYYYSIAF